MTIVSRWQSSGGSKSLIISTAKASSPFPVEFDHICNAAEEFSVNELQDELYTPPVLMVKRWRKINSDCHNKEWTL